MNGQLNIQPLAELLHEISDARLSGALRLARERVKAAVYFDEGQVVAALMNLRAFRLVEIFRRSRTADAARLGETVREGMSDEHAGLALVRAGLINPAELKRLQERQSSEVLRELLRWTDGEWSFDPRVRLAGGQRARVDATRLLVESARGYAPELISQRMRDDETLAPSRAALEGTDFGVQLRAAEAFVLSRVSGPMRLSEVVAVGGLPEEETRRAVYALALGGLLERERWPSALPDDLKSRQRAAAGASPVPATEVAQPQEERARETQPAAAEVEANTRGTVEELFARAQGATHYEVLSVARSASADEVKRAYYSHARRFHPDRLRRDADADAQQRIDAAFARIAQAYETLKDSALRASYDLKLSKQHGGAQHADASAQTTRGTSAAGAQGGASQDSTQDAASEREAEHKFQQGLSALRRNESERARTLLGE